MKKLILSLCVACGTLAATEFRNDITHQIPEIGVSAHGFKTIPNVAQYGEGDWSKVVGIARGISMKEAYEIAAGNPEITFFFYTKGGQMVLGSKEPGNYRVFRHGDTVFFSGEPWWGSAPGLADGYVKAQP